MSIGDKIRYYTLAQILADSELAPYAENALVLSNHNIPRKWSNRTTSAVLGRGAFGRVNKEIHGNAPSKVRVATKYTLNPNNLEDAITEIAVLRYLKGQPNVAQLITTIDSDTTNAELPVPAIIMAYAPKNLSDRSLYTSWDTLLKTVIGVLQGYDTLHSLGINHRDTKPANMLMTAWNEVWITDFGMSRYTTPKTPPYQDGYTGTYQYSSPEILLKKILIENNIEVEYTDEDWRAHDAWAVGSSLYDILTTRNFGETVLNANNDRITILKIIDKIFAVKGKPVADDGIVFTEYNRALPFLSATFKADIDNYPPQNPLAITNRIEHRTIHKPPAGLISEIIAVGDAIDGLLKYNSMNRFTIRQALEKVFEGLTPERKRQLSNTELRTLERPTLFDNYALSIRSTPGIDIKKIKRVLNLLYNEIKRQCDNVDMFPKKSQAFVFDRTCLYIQQLFFILQGRMNLFINPEQTIYDTLRMYVFSCLYIASNLLNVKPLKPFPGSILDIVTISKSIYAAGHIFPAGTIGITTDITVKILNPVAIYTIVIGILTEPLKFLGDTFLDRMLMGATTETHRDRADEINKICFIESLYMDFVEQLNSEQMIAFLVSFMTSDVPITKENIEAKFNIVYRAIKANENREADAELDSLAQFANLGIVNAVSNEKNRNNELKALEAQQLLFANNNNLEGGMRRKYSRKNMKRNRNRKNTRKVKSRA